MKLLLTVTAVLEALTGIAFITVPAFVVPLMIGTSFDGVAAVITARIAGAALISLAIACWFFRNNSNAAGVIKGMLFYNTAVIVIMLHGAFNADLSGPVFWSVIITHFFLAAWCMLTLRKTLGQT